MIYKKDKLPFWEERSGTGTFTLRLLEQKIFKKQRKIQRAEHELEMLLKEITDCSSSLTPSEKDRDQLLVALLEKKIEDLNTALQEDKNEQKRKIRLRGCQRITACSQ